MQTLHLTVTQHVICGSVLSVFAHNVLFINDMMLPHNVAYSACLSNNVPALICSLCWRACTQTNKRDSIPLFHSYAKYNDTHWVLGEMLPDGLALQVAVLQMIFRHAHCSNMASAKPTAACQKPPAEISHTQEGNGLKVHGRNTWSHGRKANRYHLWMRLMTWWCIDWHRNAGERGAGEGGAGWSSSQWCIQKGPFPLPW